MNDEERNSIFSRARIDRDSNFDGRFFFGVRTTGIFCRPSCPSPTAKEENVIYFDSVFQALENGFRPCHRCRPDINLEYHRGYPSGTDFVEKALDLIFNGFLNYNSLPDLAKEINVSERHLRKMFNDTVGIPPVKIARYHKSLFARKMFLGSSASVTEIAMASGFRSVRQFNDTYREIFRETPTETRRGSDGRLTEKENTTGENVLLLKYKPPFDFQQILAFMKPRTIKGVEIVSDNEYSRTFRLKEAQGFFSVRDNPRLSALELRIFSEDVRCFMAIYYRVRKMFDLDTDFSMIDKKFADDPILSPGMKDGHVPRLPTAFNGFEFCVRAILGQQITIKAAATLAGRIAEKAEKRTEPGFPPGLEYYFPDSQEIISLDLSGLGITGKRQETITRIARAVHDRSLSFDGGMCFQEFSRAFSALKGIGDWTVNYTAMRGLGIIDAFPASDLGIIKVMTPAGEKPSVKRILETAERWRPYRAYAALCIWESFNNKGE